MNLDLPGLTSDLKLCAANYRLEVIGWTLAFVTEQSKTCLGEIVPPRKQLNGNLLPILTILRERHW